MNVVRSTSAGRFVTSVFLAAVLAAMTPSALRAEDWPRWRGPNRNGTTSEVVPVWKTFPKPAWKRPTSSGSSVPVVADGVVYLHINVTDKDEEEVIAVDLATGKDLWSDRYARAEYRSQLGVGPRATPSIVDGKLITTGIIGTISCYDVKTHQRLWQINPWEELKAPLPNFAVCASPVVTSDRVIVLVGGEGAGVVGYDLATGKEVWKKFDEPAASASPIVVKRGRGDSSRLEVVAQTTLRVLGLDPKDGTLHWEHPLVFQPNGVSPTPLTIDDLVICTTQDTGTLALKLPEPGEEPSLEWWKQEMTSYFTTGSVNAQGRAYIITNEIAPLPRADVRCVDVKTGEEKWIKKGLGYFSVNVTTLGDGKLLVFDDAGNLTLANAGDEKFETLCRASVCGGTFTAPCLASGRLVVRDADEVICYDLSQIEKASASEAASSPAAADAPPGAANNGAAK